jgi:hypothetical protein
MEGTTKGMESEGESREGGWECSEMKEWAIGCTIFAWAFMSDGMEGV